MNEAQRQALAELLTATLRTKFEGNKKAAYTAIGINPATFDRALNALPIRDDRATRIMNSLWPEAQGNVDHVSLGPDPEADVVHISTPRRPLTPREERRRDSIRFLGSEPETYRERIVDWLQDLEERLDVLERAELNRLSDPSTTPDVATAAHEDGDIAGEQESRNDP